MENIEYILTASTAKDVCEKYGKDKDTLEPWEICELLDMLIDEALAR